MTREFYRSDAVLHTIPDEYICKTFNLLIAGSPYAEAFIFEQNGETAGYALLAFTYSNEAGGMVLWIEELYILPEFQGHGFGKELMTYIEKTYKDQVVRIRLEVEKSNQRAVQLYRKMGFANLDYSQMYKSTN